MSTITAGYELIGAERTIKLHSSEQPIKIKKKLCMHLYTICESNAA